MACDFCGVNKERRTIAGNAICADCFELLQGLRSGEPKMIMYFTNPRNREVATSKALEYIDDVLKDIDLQNEETIRKLKEQEIRDKEREIKEKEEEESEKAFQKKEEAFIMTTTNNLEGFKITKYIGIQGGESVWGSYRVELEDARIEAINILREKCIQAGANAVIGVDIDIMTVDDSFIVTTNGTAVIIEEIQQ